MNKVHRMLFTASALLAALAGAYVLSRRYQRAAKLREEHENRQMEADWANEGGANPAPTV
jgi:hypothetical protein